MSTHLEPAAPVNPVPATYSRLSVGQFAERFRGEVIPLSNTFSYFCASLPMSDDVLKEYLEEPVAALPPAIAAMLPRISILLVPYLERSAEKAQAKAAKRKKPVRGAVERLLDFVVEDRPADGQQSWASTVEFENETVLVFALKESDVADYHYRFFRNLAALVAELWPKEVCERYVELLREELNARFHGEVDEASWQAKQALQRRQSNIKRETQVFRDYARHSFTDTLTLYLHGICCDIDVETGPRQLPSRHLRRRLNLLRNAFPPPAGYGVFPEDEISK
jgi:hypothetical protein